jgi:hypothetical protein
VLALSSQAYAEHTPGIATCLAIECPDGRIVLGDRNGRLEQNTSYRHVVLPSETDPIGPNVHIRIGIIW